VNVRRILAAVAVIGFALIVLPVVLLTGAASDPCGAPAAATGPVTSSLLTTGQRIFGSELTARTGLDPGVVTAWMLAEESGTAATARQWADNHDWLNIGYADTATFGAGDTIWTSPVDAADATAGWLQGQDTVPGYGTASQAIQAILQTAGQPPAAQIQALQTSGWASSGYPDLPALYATVTGSSATAVPVSAPISLCPTTGGVPVSASGYVNPFEHAAGITWERTDQGVDVAMAPGSPILALGDCKVQLILADFYAGQPAIVCELLDGSLQGDWWYVAEQITPSVTVGETVKAGQQIAAYAPCCTAIETGWWTPNGGYALGHDEESTGIYHDGIATTAGADFRYLLAQLGANPGTGAGMSTGTTIGTTDYPGPGV
jgi:hypothetical protein